MAAFRLLPVTAGAMGALLLLKCISLIEDGGRLGGQSLIASVRAQDAKEEPKEEKEKEESASEEKKEEGGAEDKESDQASEEAKEKNKEGEKKEGKEENPLPPEASFSKPKPEDTNQLGGIRPEDRRFSPTELQLLQQLSDRRKKLEEWEKNIEIKEDLLSSTEKRIDEKLVELDALKKELSEMLVQYNEQEDAKVKSLVRIYENMKPRDAARIFDEIEMPILLLVIDRMSEKKAAPILASMDAKKAKQLTVELAEMRKLQSEKLSARSATPQGLQAPASTSAPAPAPAQGAP
jgi:flagellar motility protein MotE (MotC chaperone)